MYLIYSISQGTADAVSKVGFVCKIKQSLVNNKQIEEKES